MPGREDLARLLMLAGLQRGDHPMGGPKQYTNDYFFNRPRQAPTPQPPPEGWLPPAEALPEEAPPPDPNAPPRPRLKWAPTWRLPAKRPGAVPERVT